MGVIFTILAILAILLTVGGVATYFHLTPKRETPDLTSAEPEEEPVSAPTGVPEPPMDEELPARLVVVNDHLHIEGNPVPIGTVLTRDVQGVWRYRGIIIDRHSMVTAVQNGYLVDAAHLERGVQRMAVAAEQLGTTLTVSMNSAMGAMQRDFERMAEDFNRAFQTPQVRFRNASDPTPPTPPAAAKPSASTPNSTPKSAIDRLLEDDLLPDDDVGVKPKV